MRFRIPALPGWTIRNLRKSETLFALSGPSEKLTVWECSSHIKTCRPRGVVERSRFALDSGAALAITLLLNGWLQRHMVKRNTCTLRPAPSPSPPCLGNLKRRTNSEWSRGLERPEMSQ
ncbi:hypothetical protein GJ744_004695 [Endocarpon pusillum]|uniref:Uncharacterized protein n=1 Tax=Endocarpon pusillum TaxID=364733 RepID=A0A8H7A8G2_9EURO|nr:hypothetical protein GJ744_004695 [Endocarpon pusillum]